MWRVLLAGALYDYARSANSFLLPYLVNRDTHSPLLVQLVGASAYLCLAMGPCFGILPDRVGRRSTMLLSLSVVLMGTACMLAVAWWDHGAVPIALLFSYAALLSLCMVLDGTSRAALIHDVLSAGGAPGLVGAAIALRASLASLARSAGTQLTGAVLGAGGPAAVFASVSAAVCLALLLVCSTPAPPPPKRAAGNLSDDLAAVLQFLWRDPALKSVIGITILANLFWWSHQPLLQVLVERFEDAPGQHPVSPWLAGLLTSAPAYGQLCATLLVSLLNPARHGLVFCGGIALACATLPGATSASFGWALAWLFVSGACAGCFAAVQATIVMACAPPDLRSRVLGILSMGIGALSVGMALLGALAERVGAVLALRVFGVAGCALMCLWLTLRPEALRIRQQ